MASACALRPASGRGGSLLKAPLTERPQASAPTPANCTREAATPLLQCALAHEPERKEHPGHGRRIRYSQGDPLEGQFVDHEWGFVSQTVLKFEPDQVSSRLK